MWGDFLDRQARLSVLQEPHDRLRGESTHYPMQSLFLWMDSSFQWAGTVGGEQVSRSWPGVATFLELALQVGAKQRLRDWRICRGIIPGMQPDYLARLSPDVSAFVQEVETAARVDIEVVTDEGLNTGGPQGQGKLKVKTHTTPVRLLAPTSGYFPDGGVVHEVLHVRRTRVEGVPLLVGADDCNPELEQGLFELDNALEHLAIVPEELARRPERQAHWESVMHRTWSENLPGMAGHRAQRIWALVHWAFVRHVLAASTVADIACAFLSRTGLQAEADTFADELLAVLVDKRTTVCLCLDRFELPRERAALELVSSETGTRRVPILCG